MHFDFAIDFVFGSSLQDLIGARCREDSIGPPNRQLMDLLVRYQPDKSYYGVLAGLTERALALR